MSIDLVKTKQAFTALSNQPIILQNLDAAIDQAIAGTGVSLNDSEAKWVIADLVNRSPSSGPLAAVTVEQ